MDLESLVTDADYSTDIAEVAIYQDASKAQKEVLIVSNQVPDIYLSDSDIGVRGVQYAYRVRWSDIRQPCKGDEIVYQGKQFCIDDYDRLNIAEWVLYVTEA